MDEQTLAFVAAAAAAGTNGDDAVICFSITVAIAIAVANVAAQYRFEELEV